VSGDRSLDVLLTHLHSWPAVRRGGERYLHELGAGLVRAGHRVTVLSTGRRSERGVVEGVPVRWFRARGGPARYGDFGPEVAFAAQSWLSAQHRRLDVWHALGTADACAAVLRSPLSPRATAYTDLGIPDRPYREAREDLGLFRRVVAGIGCYVTLSEHAAARLRDGFGREALVVPGGIRLDAFGPGPRAPQPTLLYSGTLSEPRKNVRDLLAAAVLLRERVPDLQLWLTGPGDAQAVVSSVPGAEQVVTRAAMDSREELTRLYAAAWVTVLPSVDEAQGLTVIESLASGTPAVVRADGGGPPELVDPSCAVLSEPTVPDLRDALAEALDLSRTPGTVEACRARAARYDWDGVIVPRLVTAYREQLG
jgi:glycosyltransferase involved in cell wall biosynthesis